jgi:hypothetical protein
MRRRFLYLVASMDCASRKRLACDLAHCPRQGHCRPISAQGSLHIRAVTLAVIEGWHHQCRCRFNDPVLCLSCISSIARVSWCNVERCFIRLLKSAFDRLAQLRQCFSAKPISHPSRFLTQMETFNPRDCQHFDRRESTNEQLLIAQRQPLTLGEPCGPSTARRLTRMPA